MAYRPKMSIRSLQAALANPKLQKPVLPPGPLQEPPSPDTIPEQMERLLPSCPRVPCVPRAPGHN